MHTTCHASSAYLGVLQECLTPVTPDGRTCVSLIGSDGMMLVCCTDAAGSSCARCAIESSAPHTWNAPLLIRQRRTVVVAPYGKTQPLPVR